MLDTLYDLLGAERFGRVKDAFADSPEEGVWQLTWEWAFPPGSAEGAQISGSDSWNAWAAARKAWTTAVKVEVRSNLLSGWQPGRSGSTQDPYLRAGWWVDGVAYVPSRWRPSLPMYATGPPATPGYDEDELADLTAAFAAWPD